MKLRPEYRAAHRPDAQNMTASAPQGFLHLGPELLQPIQRHKGLNGACKAASVNPAGALALQMCIRDRIVIPFDKYEVAPGSMGSPSFTLTTPELYENLLYQP